MAFASVVQPMILTCNDNEEYMLILCLKLTTLLDHKKHPILREMHLGHFLVHKFWPIGTYHIIVFIQQIIRRFFFFVNDDAIINFQIFKIMRYVVYHSNLVNFDAKNVSHGPHGKNKGLVATTKIMV
jgi:hypothetical protein